MIKTIRERIWFVKGFFQKYSKQIVLSVIFTVVFSLLANILTKNMPSRRQEMKVGIVGQFGAGQLPTYTARIVSACDNACSKTTTEFWHGVADSR